MLKLLALDLTSDIGRLTPQPAPIPTADGEPLGIAAGPDNALWFTESNGIKIGRIPIASSHDRDRSDYTFRGPKDRR